MSKISKQELEKELEKVFKHDFVIECQATGEILTLDKLIDELNHQYGWDLKVVEIK